MAYQIIVPWWGRNNVDQHRLAALGYCTSRWLAAGYEVSIAEHAGDVWCKAAALADAVNQAPPIVILADADVYLPDVDVLEEAVSACESGAPWAIPHLHVRRLTQVATAALLGTGSLPDVAAEEYYVGVATGGLTVIRKDVAVDCPMDGRFVGWGQEDQSWGYALDLLHGGPYRPAAHADLVHLWHPPQSRVNRNVGSWENETRRIRYWNAWVARDQAAMRELVEEGRLWPSRSSN